MMPSNSDNTQVIYKVKMYIESYYEDNGVWATNQWFLTDDGGVGSVELSNFTKFMKNNTFEM